MLVMILSKVKLPMHLLFPLKAATDAYSKMLQLGLDVSSEISVRRSLPLVLLRLLPPQPLVLGMVMRLPSLCLPIEFPCLLVLLDMAGVMLPNLKMKLKVCLLMCIVRFRTS